MKKKALLLLIQLCIQNLNAQTVRVYSKDFYVSRRYELKTLEGLRSKEYIDYKFESKIFFDSIIEKSSRLPEVADSIIVEGKSLKLAEPVILFEDKKNSFILYENGCQYYSINNKFFELNCEIYQFYISYIPIRKVRHYTPGIILKKECQYSDVFYDDIEKRMP